MLQKVFNKELSALLNFTNESKLSIAVSGGSDSIALLYLASVWGQKFGFDITILTVDHNLRKESKNDVNFVKKVAHELGCKFHSLSWDSGTQKTSIQERARAGRYDLMTKKCHVLGINTLLTAHHADDKIETYLMRKQKKAGILGLSSSNSFFYNDIRILRPLSNFYKSELVSYLQNSNINWIEDHSNNLDVYARNRIRKKISSLSLKCKLQIISEIEQNDIEAKKINEEFIDFISQFVSINNYGFAMVNFQQFQNVNDNLRVQIINYLLTIIGGNNNLPRFRSVKKIIIQLIQNKSLNNTLHGCIITLIDCNILIFREKVAVESRPLKLKQFVSWDGRFKFKLNETQLKNDYYVSNLSDADYCQIRNRINLNKIAQVSLNKHRTILFTLPVIKNLEKIVAIPHISYYDGLDQDIVNNVVFWPGFYSRFFHFF